MSDKTEAPTPRRLRRARQEGDVPSSAALTQAFALVAAVALVPAAANATAGRVAERLRLALAGAATPGVSWVPGEVIALCAPLLAAGAIVAVTAGLVQSGGALSARRLAPSLAHLDPARGLAQLVSPPRLFALLRALVTALLLAVLAARGLLAEAPSIAHTLGEPTAGAALAGLLARRLLWQGALLGLALAVADYAVVRHAWWRRLRMSPEEVKRDHREAEGDPELKAARRRAHEALLTQSLVAAVREASVVVVNPTHLATALRYEAESDGAPLVVAHGRGELARQLVEAARAYGVPVIRDVPVARALAELELGDEIPEALYEAVAEILRAAWDERPPETEDTTPAPAAAAAISPAAGAAPYPRTRA